MRSWAVYFVSLLLFPPVLPHPEAFAVSASASPISFTEQALAVRSLSARLVRTLDKNGLLAGGYGRYYRRFGALLNPQNKDFVIAVGAVGPDVSTSWLMSHFTKAYFIDYMGMSAEDLRYYLAQWKTRDSEDYYFSGKYEFGFAAVESFDCYTAFYIIQELKAMGIRQDEIRVSNDRRRRVVLQFKMPAENRWRKIIFVEENLFALGRNVDLNRELRGQLDLYLQKASMGITPSIETVCTWLKPKGHLLLNPYRDNGEFIEDKRFPYNRLIARKTATTWNWVYDLRKELQIAHPYGNTMALWQKVRPTWEELDAKNHRIWGLSPSAREWLEDALGSIRWSIFVNDPRSVAPVCKAFLDAAIPFLREHPEMRLSLTWKFLTDVSIPHRSFSQWIPAHALREVFSILFRLGLRGMMFKENPYLIWVAKRWDAHRDMLGAHFISHGFSSEELLRLRQLAGPHGAIEMKWWKNRGWDFQIDFFAVSESPNQNSSSRTIALIFPSRGLL